MDKESFELLKDKLAVLLQGVTLNPHEAMQLHSIIGKSIIGVVCGHTGGIGQPPTEVHE